MVRGFGVVLLLATGSMLGCGDQDYQYTGENGSDDAAFDGDDVIVAGEGEAARCAVVPEAIACIEEFPAGFNPPNAVTVQNTCLDAGYACCDPQMWISQEAAACIAETDPRISGALDQIVQLSCDLEFAAPTFGIWEGAGTPSLRGIGVHASTGAITWYNDGAGVV